jgi:hypothetical protein
MTTQTMRYTLEDFNNLIFNGFNYDLPEETVKIISELSLQVGSPHYVKTPTFQKKENIAKNDHNFKKDNGLFKKKKNNKANEIVNDEDWDTLRTFHTTKIEQKIGIDAQIDLIRAQLNKLTDKNYIDISNKIIDIIDQLLNDNCSDEDMKRISSSIFDIASTNRFYSKIYADLYSLLANKYDMMKNISEESVNKFTELFNNIEYIDPKINYDKFCEINKTNEKRKALASFFINLMANGLITKSRIVSITRNLLAQVYAFISEENKKNEVDEITENIALLYNKELYEIDDTYERIDGYTIHEIIEKIANSKAKDYKSLSNKAIFKFMDLIEM